MPTIHLSERAIDVIASGERPPRPREAQHLASCSACDQAVHRGQIVIAVLSRRARGRNHPAPTRGPDLAPTPVVAATRLRDLAHPGDHPASGARAAGASRQWLFGAGDLEVDLQAFGDGPEAVRLLGQVAWRIDDADGGAGEGPHSSDRGSALDTPPCTIHVHHDGPPDLAITDRFGQFATGIVRGEVALVVETETDLYRLVLGLVRSEPSSSGTE